jgi:hypothetical protein
MIRTKREQQVMEVVRRRCKATAADVYEELPDAPSYNAVRGVLSILEGRDISGISGKGAGSYIGKAVPADYPGAFPTFEPTIPLDGG